MKDPLQEIFVNSGEAKACRGDGILQARSIGSCVAVAAYDPDSAVGGMAHVMLPGESPGPDIVRSLTEILGGKGITPAAMEVGGTQRRSCALHAARGRVTYTVGDSELRTLWEASSFKEAIA